MNSTIDINSLNLPDDLKSLSFDECDIVCNQIRKTIINTVSKNGGHLSSNLGTVELSVAIHKVFDSPKDKIIWDVGHQAYAHKILTGRLSEFESLRRKDGISGFMRPDESIHDAVVSGHSSTSISSALGFAYAMKKNNDNHHAIAVIGDGAFTGGLAFEGLNNAGKSGTNIIVILNYNEMSISKSNGAMAKYLSDLRTSKGYIKTKGVMSNAIEKIPVVGKPIKKTIKASKTAIREAVFHSTLFEHFGFSYIGPCDGHSVEDMCSALEYAKSLNKPVVMLVNTKKGKGYTHAEQNPGEFHGIGEFDVKTGKRKEIPQKTYSEVFGNKLCKMAEVDSRIDAITAAMKYGTGLQNFAKCHPDRFYDVGISESHAATFAAGLAQSGRLPVFAVYSTFLQRSYDQLLHDASISNSHIVLGIDRAGIVGEDGETHNGLFDVSFLSTIPNTTVYSPLGASELEYCMDKAIYECDNIACVRYPKGKAEDSIEGFEICDNYEFISDESGACENLIVTYGRISQNVLNAVRRLKNDGFDCAILRIVKIIPFDKEIIEICKKAKNVFFFEECYEEGCISGKIISKLMLGGCTSKVHLTAVEGFIKQMTTCEALEYCKLDENSIYEKIRGILDAKA